MEHKIAVIAGDGIGLLDDHLGGGADFLGQFLVDAGADLSHTLFADEQGGDPLGGAGFDQRHGQHISGSGRGTVENGVQHQQQCAEDQQHQSEDHQEKTAQKAYLWPQTEASLHKR